jgi:hypothetical protein
MIQILLLFLLFFSIGYNFLDFVHKPRDKDVIINDQKVKRAKRQFSKILLEEIIT